MNFKLEPNEVDHVMTLLMERPWKEVNGLINKIMAQANDPQMQNPPEPKEQA